MLERIRVKNIALIHEAEVELTRGLNILTGETGAGKSVLLGSLQLALGAKADKGMIRQGAEYAYAKLVFSLEEGQREELASFDLNLDGEDLLLLERKVYPNKSVCKVNDDIVTLKTMQSIAQILIDVHGQREHQSILKASKQEELLDEYGKEALMPHVKELEELYHTYVEEEKVLQEMEQLDENALRELEFLKFEHDEIEKADLKEGEDLVLEEKYTRLVSAKKIRELVMAAGSVLQNESGNGALSSVSFAIRQVKEGAELDKNLKEMEKQLLDAETLLQECSHDLDRYLDRFSLEEEDFAAVEERLNLINHLKDKYGREITDILKYLEICDEKIHKLENIEQTKTELKEKHEKTKKAYFALAEQVHAIREKEAAAFVKEMEAALLDLNFEQCSFHIELTYDEANMGKRGCDKAVFQISLNPGEPLKDLSLVASGGELSRIMLAQKSVFAKKDKIGTLVFDEIDAGISGRTAWKVSEKLAVLRNRHQVICITHLPQIAAMADAHYEIEKKVLDEKTKTSIRRLSEEESIREIGRLLGTDQVTETVLQNAAEMKELAEETKQSQSKNR